MVAYSGRIKIAATNTSEVLATDQDVDWVLLWAPLSNEQAIKIGDSNVTDTDATTEGLPIIPGEPPIKLGACNLNDIYVIGFLADKIYYIASNGYILPATASE